MPSAETAESPVFTAEDKCTLAKARRNGTSSDTTRFPLHVQEVQVMVCGRTSRGRVCQMDHPLDQSQSDRLGNGSDFVWHCSKWIPMRTWIDGTPASPEASLSRLGDREDNVMHGLLHEFEFLQAHDPG